MKVSMLVGACYLHSVWGTFKILWGTLDSEDRQKKISGGDSNPGQVN